MHELGTIFRVGEWEVDTLAGEIRAGDVTRHVEPKPMALLGYLAKHAGRVVSKDDILASVWTDSIVGEDSVWRAVYSLRKAFGDDGKEHRIIETVPKRGYRLVASVGLAGTGRGPASGRTLGWPAFALFGFLVLLSLVGGFGDSQLAIDPEPAESLSMAATGRETTAARLVEIGHSYYDGQVSTEAFADADLRRAEVLFERAIQLDPALAVAHAELASIRTLQAVRSGGDRRLFQVAAETVDLALELDYRSPEAHKSLGYLSRVAGRLTEAEAAFERAVAFRSEYAAAQDGLAYVYEARGRLDEALAIRRRLLKSGLPPARALGELGWTLYLSGDLHGAERHFRAALDYEPLQVVSTLGLARIEVLGGRSEAAHHRVEAAAEVHPSSPFVWSFLGELADRRGDLELALGYFSKGAEVSGESYASPWLRLVQVRQRVGQDPADDKILENIEAVCLGQLARGSESWGPRMWLSVIAVIRGQRHSALDRLDDAVEHGFTDLDWLRIDRLFESLHGEPRFEQILERLEARRNPAVAGLRSRESREAPAIASTAPSFE
ncbi:MAG: winged helix-turn-helix domain-containing protein [Acidobacteriota bacterium]